MYTLLELESKTFGELKKIGYELNVLPAGDRRFRQSWIDALVNVNPPLLQLLEASPAVSVEQAQEPIEVQAQEAPLESKFGRIVYLRPAQEAIGQAAEKSLDVDQTQEPIEQAAETSPGVDVDQVSEMPCEYPRNARRDCPRCVGIQSLYQIRNFVMESWVIRCLYCDYERLKDPRCAYLAAPEPVHGPDEYPWKKEAILQASAYQAPPPSYTPPGDYCCTWAPLAPSTQTFSAVDSFREAIEPVAKTSPGAEVDRVQEPIMEAAKNSPGVDPVDDELPRCCNCFGDGYVEDEFGFVKFCQCESAPRLSHQKTQRAIALAAKISLKPKSDLNPILTGIPLSDRFLARYSPPQSKTLHYELTDGYKADSEGQLSLFEVQVVAEPEPPDPDDFETLEAFREDLARWDWEHPSSFDHCSDLPNSVHSEPNSVHSELNSVHCEPNSMHSDPLEVSLDSFCEWAPCPADWYEPAALLEPSKVMELSPIHKNSSTSDFFIPTFNCWGDRFNRSDEPPDTGIFARLPKPKPPKLALHN